MLGPDCFGCLAHDGGAAGFDDSIGYFTQNGVAGKSGCRIRATAFQPQREFGKIHFLALTLCRLAYELLGNGAALLDGASDPPFLEIYVIHFHEDIRSQVFYITRLLSQSFPRVKVFPYQKHIVLMSSHDKNNSRREQIEEFLHEIMTDKNAYCGTVSFDKLTELPYAYRMACIAAQLGSVINPEGIIHSYREYSIYHYLKSVSEMIPCRMLYANELNLLMAYDNRKKTDNMKLLEIYLDMERVTNDVAAKMHLHRNSVTYRINKIQEIIKLDLDDANVRLNLQMSFKMLKMIELGIVQ